MVFQHSGVVIVLASELSGWMRYDGYYLSGHMTKVLSYVASDTKCWESCLQETSFLCLALAYATRGNRTCFLYDTKALFRYADWTSAVEMTYYEYCQNGNTKCPQWCLNVGIIIVCWSIQPIFCWRTEPLHYNHMLLSSEVQLNMI